MSGLSRRELEVMQLLEGHMTTAEVANRLCLSVHTIRSHVKSALRKLDVNCRQEGFRKLYEQAEIAGYAPDLVPSTTERLFRNALEIIAATSPKGTLAGDLARKTLTTAAT